MDTGAAVQQDIEHPASMRLVITATCESCWQAARYADGQSHYTFHQFWSPNFLCPLLQFPVIVWIELLNQTFQLLRNRVTQISAITKYSSS